MQSIADITTIMKQARELTMIAVSELNRIVLNWTHARRRHVASVGTARTPRD